jgi:hypothetical protein
LNSHTLFIIKCSNVLCLNPLWLLQTSGFLFSNNVNDLRFSACFLHRTSAHVKQTTDKPAIQDEITKNQVSVNVYIRYRTGLYSSPLAGDPQDFERLFPWKPVQLVLALPGHNTFTCRRDKTMLFTFGRQTSSFPVATLSFTVSRQMIRTLTLLTLLAGLCTMAYGQNVTVNFNSSLGTVPPWGQGIGTAVYDGNLTDAAVPGLVKNAGYNIMRFPGGSYADIYHWQTNTATGGAFVNSNDTFDNFMTQVKAAGVTALVTVNYGSNVAGNGGGDPSEAAGLRQRFLRRSVGGRPAFGSFTHRVCQQRKSLFVGDEGRGLNHQSRRGHDHTEQLAGRRHARLGLHRASHRLLVHRLCDHALVSQHQPAFFSGE